MDVPSEEKTVNIDLRFIEPWMPDLSAVFAASFKERQVMLNSDPTLRRAFYRYTTQKASHTKAQKKEEKRKQLEKARELVPQILATEMALEYNDNIRPSPALLEQLRRFIESGLPLEQIRSTYFQKISDESWGTLKRYLFSTRIAQVEDLANMYEVAFVRHKTILKKRIRMIKREIKELKKKGHQTNSIMLMLINAENQLMQMERDRLKDYVSYGVVDSKEGPKNAPLHVHFSVPRPKQDEADKAKVIEPEVLDENGEEIET
jgi:hypothetical protein